MSAFSERERMAARRLTRPQKAAVIIGLLDEATAKSMLSKMSKQELKSLGMAMTELETVAEQAIDEAIVEFSRDVTMSRSSIGGRTKAKSLLSSVLSDDELSEVVGAEAVDEPQKDVWTEIDALDTELLVAYVRNENPQTAAALLSRMKPKKAAAIFEALSPDIRTPVVEKLVSSSQLDPQSLHGLEAALRTDLTDFAERRAKAQGPGDFLGELAKSLPSEVAGELVACLEERDPALGDEVRKKVFTFADIRHRVEAMYVTTILKKLDMATLVRALKLGKERDAETYDFIIANISARFAQQIEEELADAPRISLKDAEAALVALMETIASLAESGEIKLVSADEPEDYI